MSCPLQDLVEVKPLRPGDCAVWVVDTRQLAAAVPDWELLLDSIKLARARRFRFEEHRRAYVVSHAILRVLLARYLGVSIWDLQVRKTRQGKPYVVPEVNHSDLRFNLSHSDQWTMLAFMLRREVGVDVEVFRIVPDWDAVAACAFTDAEREVVLQHPESQRSDAFLQQWTRKEAFLKLSGKGIGPEFNCVSVNCDPEKQSLEDHESPPSDGVRHFRSFDLSMPGQFAGTLAVEECDVQLSCQRFTIATAIHYFEQISADAQ